MGRPCHVEVKLKPGESQEKLLRRFLKKCKKADVLKEYINKTSYFKNKRQIKREKQLKNLWLKNVQKNDNSAK